MTDPELRERLRIAATTYPRWMDQADAVATWSFRRLVEKASALQSQGRSLRQWRADAESVLRDMDGLRRRVEGAAPRPQPQPMALTA